MGDNSVRLDVHERDDRDEDDHWLNTSVSNLWGVLRGIALRPLP